jgi:glucan phosphoethanolaminetransferase (alkaline phosphatase superfamily)
MRKVIPYLLKELLFWFALPVLFLGLYVGRFQFPLGSAFLHLYAVALLALAAVFLTAFIFQSLSSQRVARTLSALLYATLLYALCLYYSLVIVGLKTWGRVISEELMASYAGHLEQLTDALGLPFYVAVALLVAGYALLVLACYRVLTKHHAQAKFAFARISPALLATLLFSLFALVGYALREYTINPNTASKEPFQLTLFAGKPLAALRFNTHKISFNPALDPPEDAVRAGYRASPDAHKKNVVLIIVDGLRPDHMGVYGYARETTPFLSSLVKQGQATKVSNLRSVCGETACGFASLFSSRYPHQMPTTPLTLQEVLSVNGYQTRVILSGDHTNFYNLRQVYGKIDHYFDGSMVKGGYFNDDQHVVDKTKTLPPFSGKPTIFIYHLLSAHVVGKRHEKFNLYSPHKSYLGRSEGRPQPEYYNHYDNGVLQTDAMIKELVASLQAKNYLNDAMVVITSDHGEGLGEYGLFTHTNSVREELLRVPLLLANFGKGGQLEAPDRSFASLLAISPTILKELGVTAPNSWLGETLQTPVAQEKKPAFTFFQMHPSVGFYDHRQASVLWKYWVNTYSHEEFAYNLSIDPQERNNLIGQVPFALRTEWQKLAHSTKVNAAP